MKFLDRLRGPRVQKIAAYVVMAAAIAVAVMVSAQSEPPTPDEKLEDRVEQFWRDRALRGAADGGSPEQTKGEADSDE